MIETAPLTDEQHCKEYASELAPNVWLCQNEKDGQFVEIMMPPFELNDLIDECIHTFPEYVIQVYEVLGRNHPQLLPEELRPNSEQIKGLRNTQLLGTVLAHYSVREEKAMPILPELQQAFGLAMRGRLRLIADPVPDL